MLAACLGVAWLGLVLWTILSLLHPPRRTYASALARNRPGEPSELLPAPRAFTSWSLKTGSLQLPVWEIPGDVPQGPIIILSHGWGDSRIGALSRIPWLVSIASTVIAWDMRGNGEAPGLCTLGVREALDLQVLCERLAGRAPIVLFGWSLGAGVSIDAARALSGVQGVIAEAPYRHVVTPARHMLQAIGMPWRSNLGPALAAVGAYVGAGMAWNRPQPFDRATKAAQLRCPLLVLHGADDVISPAEDGQEIARAASGTYVQVAGGGHHGLWTTPESAAQCAKAVTAFIAALTQKAVEQGEATSQQRSEGA